MVVAPDGNPCSQHCFNTSSAKPPCAVLRHTLVTIHSMTCVALTARNCPHSPDASMAVELPQVLRAAAEINSRIARQRGARHLLPMKGKRAEFRHLGRQRSPRNLVACETVQVQVVWNHVGSACQFVTAHLQIVMKPKREKDNKIKEHGSSKTQVARNFVAQGLGLASAT